jgi:pimeloyl-ACP methyl ester carboxylesterase
LSWVTPKILFHPVTCTQRQVDMEIGRVQDHCHVRSISFTSPASTAAVAFYVTPSNPIPDLENPSYAKLEEPKPKKKLWIVSSGNMQYAISWLPLIQTFYQSSQYAQEHEFLLVDYPGYGLTQGNILHSQASGHISKHLSALTQLFLGQEQNRERFQQVGGFGYSMGCASLLHWMADSHSDSAVLLDRLVLVAPFTSISGIAQDKIGLSFQTFLSWMHLDLDNKVALQQIVAKKKTNLKLHIIHGKADNLIPSKMGQELSTRVLNSTFIPVDGADHVTVLNAQTPIISSLLA